MIAQSGPVTLPIITITNSHCTLLLSSLVLAMGHERLLLQKSLIPDATKGTHSPYIQFFWYVDVRAYV